MPQEVRLRAHDATFLVTVPVADKKGTRLGHVKPPPAAIEEMSKSLIWVTVPMRKLSALQRG